MGKQYMRSVAMGTIALLLAACGGKTPPPPPPGPSGPPPPSGPTKTDFEAIARQLVGRCVTGGWIERWRSTHSDVNVAKPRVRLTDFEDRTGQDLDGDYLRSVLEQRMRLSGVYEVVQDEDRADFVAKGSIRRMAERVRGERVSVYTAILEFDAVATGRRYHQCESTVRGEM